MTDFDARLPLTELSDEEKLLQEAVRKFARKEIAPLVREMDEAQKMSPALIAKLFDQGFMGIEVAEEHGGVGASFFSSILVIEEISAVDPAVGTLVDVQNTLIVNALLRWATAEQKANYLPRIVTNLICSYALSEASSGSDAFALKTSAHSDGDGFVLNGSKLWISSTGCGKPSEFRFARRRMLRLRNQDAAQTGRKISHGRFGQLGRWIGRHKPIASLQRFKRERGLTLAVRQDQNVSGPRKGDIEKPQFLL